jgi:DNA-binding MarR family transcriptional regulator
MKHEQVISAGSNEDLRPWRTKSNSTDCALVEHIVKKLIAERRRRYSFFPEGLFADPAWEILLTLTLAESRHQRLSVSRLCSRVDVPPTTTLRWIGKLTEEGLLLRRDDLHDKRRKYIELSPDAFAMMGAFCATAEAATALAA